MFGNVLGRLDPKTNDMKEYPVKTPASGPHGLAFDKAGNLWFTANSKGYIGKLDPKTGDITEYKMPEGVRDPHTPLFAPNGMLFFTAQNANYVGRLDPKTGDIKVVKTPTDRAAAVRPQDRKVPDLDRSGRRRRYSQHEEDSGRQARDRGKRRQQSWPDRNRRRHEQISITTEEVPYDVCVLHAARTSSPLF